MGDGPASIPSRKYSEYRRRELISLPWFAWLEIAVWPQRGEHQGGEWPWPQQRCWTLSRVFNFFFFCVEKEDDSTQKSWDQTFRVANIKIPVQCMVSITALNQAALENGNGLRGCESCWWMHYSEPLRRPRNAQCPEQTPAAGEAWAGQAFRSTLLIVRICTSYPRVVYREGEYRGVSCILCWKRHFLCFKGSADFPSLLPAEPTAGGRAAGNKSAVDHFTFCISTVFLLETWTLNELL